ncbi:cupin [Curvibacter sp. RS43]|uniref:Cupin n=1 Tax=Curvibacter microcysteis TaxID=3026419 RepID=A0ABT5MKR8_9BURK|nr:MULTISPECIES: cupin [unclassified Curvibacter]MDD0808911.1 cupin [Curvibacter sp. RS43]MDD0817108.1 cupin [Curvibacter sp. HBC28]
MTEAEFNADLATRGFTEVSTVQREAGGQMDEHTHAFEARALILEGDITIETQSGSQRYQPGDIFHLQHEEPHAETYGPQGVRYRVGRKPG